LKPENPGLEKCSGFVNPSDHDLWFISLIFNGILL